MISSKIVHSFFYSQVFIRIRIRKLHHKTPKKRSKNLIHTGAMYERSHSKARHTAANAILGAPRSGSSFATCVCGLVFSVALISSVDFDPHAG